MAQDPLEVEHVPSSPEVADGECMPERVGAESYASDPDALPQQPYIPSDISLTGLEAASSGEQ